MVDLLVRGGTVVSATGAEKLDVAVEGGRISAVGAPGTLGTEARKVIDATGKMVLPGGVDPHTHYGVEFEGLLSAEPQEYTWAAAWGGTTTIIDFALHSGTQTLHDAIQAKKDEAAGRMAVDYSLHAMLVDNTSFEAMEEIGDVIRGGIATVKTLTTYAWMSDDGHRYGVMSEVAEHGGMSIVHAEDDAIANWLTKKYLREGKTHGAYVSETRGALVEEAAIRRCLLLAERTGSPLHVFHMCAGTGIQALREYRQRGVPVYGETLPIYLTWTQDILWQDDRRGLLWNNIPSLKTQEDQDACWAGIVDDAVSTVSSDHFAIKADVRYEKMGSTVDQSQGGQSAVEMRLPVLWSYGVATGRISPSRFVELTSTNPAKVMGLFPRKGQIAVGSDADIAILDPEKRWHPHPEDCHMIVDYNNWEDVELTGKVVTTILRGTVLIEDGNWVAPSKTLGEFQTRKILPEIRNAPRDPSATFASAGASVTG
ncbi:MAG: amidohydrolase family protein [Thermoleophilia bacterium]